MKSVAIIIYFRDNLFIVVELQELLRRVTTTAFLVFSNP